MCNLVCNPSRLTIAFSGDPYPPPRSSAPPFPLRGEGKGGARGWYLWRKDDLWVPLYGGFFVLFPVPPPLKRGRLAHSDGFPPGGGKGMSREAKGGDTVEPRGKVGRNEISKTRSTTSSIDSMMTGGLIATSHDTTYTPQQPAETPQEQHQQTHHHGHDHNGHSHSHDTSSSSSSSSFSDSGSF
jgi:hypothetical protein